MKLNTLIPIAITSLSISLSSGAAAQTKKQVHSVFQCPHKEVFLDFPVDDPRRKELSIFETCTSKMTISATAHPNIIRIQNDSNVAFFRYPLTEKGGAEYLEETYEKALRIIEKDKKNN